MIFDWNPSTLALESFLGLNAGWVWSGGAFSTGHDVSASVTITFSATAAAPATDHNAAADLTITFDPTASAPGTDHYADADVVTIVFTPSADAPGTDKFGDASCTIVFDPTCTETAEAHVSAGCTIHFHCRADDRGPVPLLDPLYRGRWRLGDRLPLFVQPQLRHGGLAAATGRVSSRVYRLDTGRLVESVPEPLIDHSRVAGAMQADPPVRSAYEVGRHVAVAGYAAGGRVAVGVTIFEVIDGGDVNGPVLAAHDYRRPGGEYVLTQLQSGRLARGRSPSVD